MTAVPPRRLRPSPERRVEVAVNTHTALSAKGSVSVAAPVDPNRGRAHPYVPPVPPSSPFVAFARYDDPNTSTATFYQVAATDLGDSEGDPSPYVAPGTDGGGEPSIEMTALGWYQVFVHAQVSDLSAGDVVHMRLHWPSAGYDTDAYGISDDVGVSLSLVTFPSKNYDATDGHITVKIDNPAGGTINSCSVHVLKLTDGI